MTLWAYFLLSGTIIISGCAFFLFRKANPLYLKLSLAFSGAYLFAITVLHLIPETYQSEQSSIGIYILGGFLFQILLELLSEGIEHGHIHIHTHKNRSFPIALMTSLCIHSFLEGMPLAGRIMASSSGNQLLAGIILHHIPVSFALMSMLIQSGIKNRSAVFLLIAFALMSPAGSVFSQSLSTFSGLHIAEYFPKVMGVVIGIFLHISTTILFETGEHHRFNIYKFVMILIGVALALL